MHPVCVFGSNYDTILYGLSLGTTSVTCVSTKSGDHDIRMIVFGF